MRTYPNNSPQAAARIVALAMLADGHLCKTELDLLERMDAIARLGSNLGNCKQSSMRFARICMPPHIEPGKQRVSTQALSQLCWRKSMTRHCAQKCWLSASL